MLHNSEHQSRLMDLGDRLRNEGIKFYDTLLHQTDRNIVKVPYRSYSTNSVMRGSSSTILSYTRLTGTLSRYRTGHTVQAAFCVQCCGAGPFLTGSGYFFHRLRLWLRVGQICMTLKEQCHEFSTSIFFKNQTHLDS